MANQALESFAAYMEVKDIKVSVIDADEGVCRVGLRLDNTQISIFLVFNEEQKDVHFIGREFIKIPEDKTDIALKLCNESNKKFRWIKFVLDYDENEVIALCDAYVEESTLAEECYEIIGRMVGIVDEAYPDFMKAIWA